MLGKKIEVSQRRSEKKNSECGRLGWTGARWAMPKVRIDQGVRRLGPPRFCHEKRHNALIKGQGSINRRPQDIKTRHNGKFSATLE